MMKRGMERISEAVSSNDPSRVALLSLPLLFVDRNGAKTDIGDVEDFKKWYAVIFDERTRAAIREAQLEELTIARNEGAALGLGAVWYKIDATTGETRLATINHRAWRE